MQHLTDKQAAQLVAEHYGIRGRALEMESEWGGTYRFTSDEGQDYLLKVAPGSVPEGRTRMEVDALLHLQLHQLAFDLPKIIDTRSGKPLMDTPFGLMRLYRWIPGRLWREVSPKSDMLLKDLGTCLGALTNALSSFSHEHADGTFGWLPQNVTHLGERIHLIPDMRKGLITEVLRDYDRLVSHLTDHLPRQVTYNDANECNIVVTGDVTDQAVRGFIDFGDLEFGLRVGDLAVAIAYATMHFPDPIGAACQIVRGFHSVTKLEEPELEILFHLVRCRLAISVVTSASRAGVDPDNAYWQVSDSGAWDLLDKLSKYSDHLALCRFRHACDLEPSPTAALLRSELINHRREFFPVIGRDLSCEDVIVFDWSVGSLDMGTFKDIADVQEMTHKCFTEMESGGVRVGIGRYNEPRAVYTTDEYAVPGNRGTEMRTIHIGIDIFVQPGTPLHATLDGEVFAVVNDAGDKEYGPLVILRHQLSGIEFYTLYGHNDLETLKLWQTGDSVSKGDIVAYVGNYPANGNWVPHSHFQVITHMLGYRDDFPGVALSSQREVWLSLCPDPNLILGIQHDDLVPQHHDPRELADRRRAALAPNLSYAPLHFVRGWKTHLYASDGTAYLDTRNNIAHVGHEHPDVVRAGQKQMAVLNTNTRYLHYLRIELAERLLATLPDRLQHVYFVNSGSEANDLALRIARNHTHSHEALVMWQGYVGHTEACIDASPYKFDGPGGAGKKDFIHVLPHPDSGTDEAIRASTRAAGGQGPLTFIHESLPGCAGQVVPPHDYFRGVYDVVRPAGGICIADEVQTGLGRVGEKYWAFQLYDIEPDIVTIGKPFGNGHPVAAVAVTSALAESFDNGMEYFNSFGGNPVSCAIAMAVLDVIEEENLQHRAMELGSLWLKELEELAASSMVISDVRGNGLYLGIEFSDKSGAPLSQVAAYVQKRMLEHRILTSLDGPHENILKLKPPMSIRKTDIRVFNEVLGHVLCENYVSQ